MHGNKSPPELPGLAGRRPFIGRNFDSILNVAASNMEPSTQKRGQELVAPQQDAAILYGPVKTWKAEDER